AAPERAAQAPEPGQVARDRRHELDARVEVLDPVDGHLVDPHAVPLGEEQQLGVEEPAVVGDEWQEVPGGVGPERLEPALRVREAGAEAGPDEQVVTAGEDFTPHAPADMGVMGEPSPDRDLAVTGEKRSDEREEATE